MPARFPPLAVAAGLALLDLLIHLVFNRGYGYFRDELYLMACGDHLDWGYVDHAPLIALIARVSRAVFGDSLSAIRFLPAVAGAGKVLLTGLVAIELGGGALAVLLAGVCVLSAPIYLGIDNLLSMNAFEPLFWMGAAWLAARAIRLDRPRLWIWIGVLCGLGLENKHSTLFFAFAVVCGFLLTSGRRVFLTRWPWIAAALALALFLPNLIWQYTHGWPTLETLRNVRATGKNVVLGPIEFLWQQVLMLSPVSMLVWAAGLGFLLIHREGKRFRALGWTYLALLAVMMALHGKNYYLAPVYPLLFAAGGVFWERTWTRGLVALAVLVVAGGVVSVPLVLPVLPVPSLIAYMRTIGFQPPKTEVGHAGPLPQHFGDMFGWPEMVERVAQVYDALPPAERARAAILTGNYGEAGAIDFFGPRYGLPKAISGHQNYFFWGPRDASGDVLILLQARRRDAEHYCARVDDAGRVGHPYAMAEEHFEVLVCRGLSRPLVELWPRLKHWN